MSVQMRGLIWFDFSLTDHWTKALLLLLATTKYHPGRFGWLEPTFTFRRVMGYVALTGLVTGKSSILQSGRRALRWIRNGGLSQRVTPIIFFMNGSCAITRTAHET